MNHIILISRKGAKAQRKKQSLWSKYMKIAVNMGHLQKRCRDVAVGSLYNVPAERL
jgi:hypothetical protein